MATTGPENEHRLKKSVLNEIMTESAASHGHLLNHDNLMKLKNEMIKHVAKSQAVFKNLQADEADLDIDEKEDIASKILEASPGQFLARFGKFLNSEYLKYFENLESGAGSYEVDYYLQQAKKSLSSNSSRVVVKNRRYAALKKLINEGSYFSETEMRRRDPLLYEHLVGKHLSEEEQDEINRMDMSTMTLLGLLLEHMDRDAARALQLQQQEMEEAAMEESDEDSEEEENEEAPELPEEERDLLRREFVTHMYRAFIEGKDKDFDYSTVDENAEYDNITAQQQDAEDKYFDSETPNSNPGTPKLTKQTSTSSEDELDAYMKKLLNPRGKNKGKLHKKSNPSHTHDHFYDTKKAGQDHPVEHKKENTSEEPYLPHVRRSHPHVTSPKHEPKNKEVGENDEVYTSHVPRSHPHHKSPTRHATSEGSEGNGDVEDKLYLTNIPRAQSPRT